VPVTTRPPGPGEAGREYRFVTEIEFDAMASRGELLEWAQFGAHKYGTPRGPLAESLSAGLPAVVEMDLAGARQLRLAMPAALLVFLVPAARAEPARPLTSSEPGRPESAGPKSAATAADLAAGLEFDITLVNASVEEVCRQLVALMAAQPAQ
jgi:guanylate kinase